MKAADSTPLRVVPTLDDVSDDIARHLAKLEQELRGLRQALDSRAPIEQAKGMLMMRYGIPADHAFRVLARWSSHHNVKLRTVATTLVTICVEDPEVAGQDPAPERLLRQALSDERSRTT